MAIYGVGNNKISQQEIKNYLGANPGIANDPNALLAAARQHGVSLNQIQQAAPDLTHVQASNPNLTPWLMSQGVKMPQGGSVVSSGGPQTGLIGSEQALGQGFDAAAGALQGGINQGRADFQQSRDDINSMVNKGANLFGGFAQQGNEANARMAALSGVSGNAAQQEAFDNFNSSPGQQFLRDRGERALLRNSAAIGGLGGGRVRKELASHGIGMAQQDFSDNFNRMGQVANQGLSALGQQGQLYGQGANLLGNVGMAQAGQSFNAGQLGANMATNLGQNLSQGRTRTGELMAQNAINTSSSLANLTNQQGQGLSQIAGRQGSNLANVIMGAGSASENANQALANQQANQAIMAGNARSNIAPIQGIAGQVGGIATQAMGLAGNALSGAGVIGSTASKLYSGG